MLIAVKKYICCVICYNFWHTSSLFTWLLVQQTLLWMTSCHLTVWLKTHPLLLLSKLMTLSTDVPSAGCISLASCGGLRKSHTWWRGIAVSGVRRMNEVNARRARLVPGWVTVFGRYTISVCNKPTRSTQPCIPPGSLNRVPASAGVRAGMSPLPGGR